MALYFFKFFETIRRSIFIFGRHYLENKNGKVLVILKILRFPTIPPVSETQLQFLSVIQPRITLPFARTSNQTKQQFIFQILCYSHRLVFFPIRLKVLFFPAWVLHNSISHRDNLCFREVNSLANMDKPVVYLSRASDIT